MSRPDRDELKITTDCPGDIVVLTHNFYGNNNIPRWSYVTCVYSKAENKYLHEEETLDQETAVAKHFNYVHTYVWTQIGKIK